LFTLIDNNSCGLFMKYIVGEENRDWQRLQEVLSYTFRDNSLLAEAMTHGSFANEYHSENLPDNERLEFLGDAVLDLVVSQYLMETQPAACEGELTRVRADVVALPSLARLAESLELGSCLLLGRGEERSGGRTKASLLADALEALFGAIFTDGGFESVRKVIMPLFIPLLQQASTDEGQDFKSRLQENFQATHGELPVYRLAETKGPPHDRIYRVEVFLNNRLHGSGQGRTKKSAEQAAAEAALIELGRSS
jgi:ribonuclease-3